MTELRLRNKKGSGGEGRRFSDTETHTHIHFASWLTNTRQIQAPRVTKKNKVRSSLLLPPPLFVCVFGSC